MALKMKENYQKNATATVTLANAPITTNNKQENLPKDCEDVESIKGKFSWKLINGFHVPYIIRIINGEYLKFVSVRIAETQLLRQYIHCFHADIYTCISIKSNFISNSEANLLNDINQVHADRIYSKEMFVAGKDCIVSLEDVHEFYTFLNVCHKKLLCNIPPGDNEKCGFIRINSESIVPYCTHDSQKYLPMFYFEGATESLKPQAVKLKNWNLAYLKFCLLVQGTINELFYSDFCTMVSLDCIKNFYTDLNVEEYWPATEVNTHFLTYQKSSHVNPTGIWIRAPIEVVPAENTIPHILIEPAPSKPQSITVTKNNYLSGCPASQMVNLYSTQAQPPSTTSAYSLPARNQSIAAQCYNAGSAMSQGSSLINSAGHVVPPPPLVHAGNMAPEIGNTVSYSNTVPNSQCVTTIYNGITNSNVMSHSSQMRQFYTQSSNNGKALQQLQQQQTITNHNIGWELTRIPERMCTHITSNNDAYKELNENSKQCLENVKLKDMENGSHINSKYFMKCTST